MTVKELKNWLNFLKEDKEIKMDAGIDFYLEIDEIIESTEENCYVLMN